MFCCFATLTTCAERGATRPDPAEHVPAVQRLQAVAPASSPNQRPGVMAWKHGCCVIRCPRTKEKSRKTWMSIHLSVYAIRKRSRAGPSSRTRNHKHPSTPCFLLFKRLLKNRLQIMLSALAVHSTLRYKTILNNSQQNTETQIKNIKKYDW